VTPLLCLAVGVAVLATGIVVLSSYGSRFRVGRLLSATPQVSVADALGLAAEGTARYVRVDGRIDSAEDFPDEHQRPLVFRRRRLESRRRGRWTKIDEQVERVPFEVREDLDAIVVDGAALDTGLVVLPRESSGTAGEVPDRMPAGLPASTPVRYRISQVSAVEHAIVLGVPVRAMDGTVAMTAGLGRPLVLSTLEIPEAMRVLGGGSRIRAFLASGLVGGGLVLCAIGLTWALAQALV
jgi:hypothetical protein